MMRAGDFRVGGGARSLLHSVLVLGLGAMVWKAVEEELVDLYLQWEWRPFYDFLGAYW